jgi:hypothetical protein
MTNPDDEEVVLECVFPHEFLTKLTNPDDVRRLRELGVDWAAVARGVLEFLADQGTDIRLLDPDFDRDPRRYHAVVAGARLQIRVKSLLLDSIRDCVVLAVVVGATAANEGRVPAALAGAAIASIVRAALASIHRLNEEVGERCIAKAIVGIEALRKQHAVDRKEIASWLTASACVLPKCRYRDETVCTLRGAALDDLLQQMERSEVLTKVGATSYALK